MLVTDSQIENKTSDHIAIDHLQKKNAWIFLKVKFKKKAVLLIV